MKPTFEPIKDKLKPIKSTLNYNRSYPFFLVGIVIVSFGLMVGTVIKLIFTVSQPLNSEINSKTLTSEVGSPVKTNSSSAGSDVIDVITLAKFKQIQNGMTLQQVQELIGNSGKLVISSNDDKLYQWQNPQGSNAIIEFKRNQVISKSQAGLK